MPTMEHKLVAGMAQCAATNTKAEICRLKETINSRMDSAKENVKSLQESSYNYSSKWLEMNRVQQATENFYQIEQIWNAAPIEGLQPHWQTQDTRGQINDIQAEIQQLVEEMLKTEKSIRIGSTLTLESWKLLKHLLDHELHTAQQIAKATNELQVGLGNLDILRDNYGFLMKLALELLDALKICSQTFSTQQIIVGLQMNQDFAYSDIPTLIEQVIGLIKQLAQDTFIIVRESWQVVKIDRKRLMLPGKIPMEICLLAGAELELKDSPPTVHVSLVEEQICQEIYHNGFSIDPSTNVTQKGKINSDSAKLEYCQTKKYCCALFPKMALEDFKRTEPKSPVKPKDSKVMEDKLALLFHVEFKVKDIEFQLWRFSLPVVISTNHSQDCLAWAVVTWDNLTSEVNRIPFEVPKTATCKQITEMFNSRFKVMVGSPLSTQNLEYFEKRLADFEGYPNNLSWSTVFKTSLPETKFTLWEWFFEAAKLIEKYLKDAWEDGHVIAFMTRDDPELLFRKNNSKPGTFLLRFSEKTLGKISIVWRHSDKEVYFMAPSDGTDFKTKVFVEKLDQFFLGNVYPNTEKKEAFKKLFENFKPLGKFAATKKGYVPVMPEVVNNPSVSEISSSDTTLPDTSRIIPFQNPTDSFCNSHANLSQNVAVVQPMPYSAVSSSSSTFHPLQSPPIPEPIPGPNCYCMPTKRKRPVAVFNATSQDVSGSNMTKTDGNCTETINSPEQQDLMQVILDSLNIQ